MDLKFIVGCNIDVDEEGEELMDSFLLDSPVGFKLEIGLSKLCIPSPGDLIAMYHEGKIPYTMRVLASSKATGVKCVFQPSPDIRASITMDYDDVKFHVDKYASRNMSLNRDAVLMTLDELNKFIQHMTFKVYPDFIKLNKEMENAKKPTAPTPVMGDLPLKKRKRIHRINNPL